MTKKVEESIELKLPEKSFTLVPKDIPEMARKGKRSAYAELVQQFNGMDEPSQYVQYSDRKSATVKAGLYRAITLAGLRGTVGIVKDEDDIWLVRK